MPSPENTPPAPASTDPIRAFNAQGEEILIPREQWRTEVLPNLLRETWDDPGHLYTLVLNSINDGFAPEVTAAAEQLYRADPNPARGTCIFAVALLAQSQLHPDRLAQAEQILVDFLANHGEEGSILTNLAKVQYNRGDRDQAGQTLWRAIELEPNLDNGLGWFLSLEQERGGEPAVQAALTRVAALDGSWRARLWQARIALAEEDLATALNLYREALDRAPNPVPGDFLMQMSGDLGANGHIAELLAFTAPHFIPEVHGLTVGNNLIKANLDLRQPEQAIQLITALAALNLPEWKQTLDFWSQEVARLIETQNQPSNQDPGQIQIGMLRLDGPVWLPAGASGWSYFGRKDPHRPSVTFLGGTAEPPRSPVFGQAVDTDLPGRFSRALPLFLAEQVDLRTNIAGRALLPWSMGGQASPQAVNRLAGKPSEQPAEHISGQSSEQPAVQPESQPAGFIVGSAPWSAEVAVQCVANEANQTTYVVTVHLDASVDPWTAELTFLRTADGTEIGQLDAEFPSTHPEEGIPTLAEEVIALLGGEIPSPAYQLPAGAAFGPYLQRLEQLLAVRCASIDGISPNFLAGPREILEANLQAAQADPENLPTRLLLLETANTLDRLHPELTTEFQPRLHALTATTHAGTFF